MFFDAWFAEYMFSYGIDLLSAVFVFVCVMFGFLWISLVVCFKVGSEFVKIYGWDKTIQSQVIEDDSKKNGLRQKATI